MPTDITKTFDVGGREIPLTLRRNRQARRIILRIQPSETTAADGIAVTLPHHVSEAEVFTWLATKQDWVLRQLSKLKPRILFTDGATVPYLGQLYLVHHTPGRGTVKIVGEEIQVFGGEEHLPRRLQDWLRKQARSYIQNKVTEKSGQLGYPAGRLSIRDTRSRWGSCATNGNLSFCWRLIMAPEMVLDYVVAHEVAHLKEHNHSARFWAEVSKLTEHQDQAQAWLNVHGDSLRRYG